MVGVAGVVLEAPGSGPRMEVADVLQPGSAGGVARAIPVGADAQVEAATDFVHGGGLPGLLTGGLLAQARSSGAAVAVPTGLLLLFAGAAAAGLGVLLVVS